MFFPSSQLSDSSEESSSDAEEPQSKRRCLENEPSSVYNPKRSDGFTASNSFERCSSEDDRIESENSRRESQSTEDSYQPSDDDKVTKQTAFKENKAKKMMERMGYREGEGLGKHAQGIVEPVEPSKQRGRRGLGLHIKGLEAANLVWDSKLEVIEVHETVKWLVEANHNTLDQPTLTSWLVKGPVKLSLEGESHFCDPDLLRNVLGSKSVFDELEPEEMRKARSRSNPFESIRGGIFLNRAAMKMANMDRVFDFIFSKPVDQLGEPMVTNNELLFFADVCAGPGGFSEYILWRKKWLAKGFGFTLRGDCDFRLQDFHAGPCETFHPHYGKNGIEGNGDVMDPDNISVFTDFVLSQTEGLGVHFAMADGGFSVEGQENIQEILSKQLYLCQFLVGLSIVRTGGSFLCKVFDLFTPFSVGLVYLMYKSFHRVTIHKPNTSRPANSERYLICQWKRQDSEIIRNHLYRCNKWSWSNKDKSYDVNELVSMNTMLQDEAFFNYIVESNNSIGERQVVNLVKVAAYCRDNSLHESIQGKMRSQCLDYWQVPDKARTIPPRLTPELCTDDMFDRKEIGFMATAGNPLGVDTLSDAFKSVHDWQCVVLGCSETRDNCTFYLGLGRSRVYRKQKEKWVRIEESIELSAKTLIYGEMVEELRGEGRAQRKVIALHIIDAFFLGGDDVQKFDLATRLAKAALFCRALDKPGAGMVPLRTKELFPVSELHRLFGSLKLCQLKKAGGIERLCYNLGHSVFLPGGAMFLKTTKTPYMKSVSRKTHHVYYFHTIKRVSTYEKDIGDEAINPAIDCFTKRRLWWWDDLTLDSRASDGSLNRIELERFIERMLRNS